MQPVELSINHLPSPTWRWLKVNDCKVSFPEAPAAEATADYSAFDGITTGAGQEFNQYMTKANTFVETLEGKSEEPIRLPMNFSAENTLNRYGFRLQEDAERVVIMDFTSAQASGSAGVQTKAILERNAVLTLVQIHRCGDEFTLVNDLGIQAQDGATAKIIHVVLSGKHTMIGTEVALQGDKSVTDIHTAYLVEQDHRLDMNYNIPVYGKQTRSDLSAKGVLRDTAWKTMRDTLDFKRGCAGSSGDEMEDVMLLSDGIVNQSVPLILCEEEDVEGNHGASIGQLREDLLFYLESRGIPEAAIYEMLAQARLDAVIKMIPDAQTVAQFIEPEEDCPC